MTVQNIAAALLIILPLAFNLFFFLLGRRFDYPNILRSPTGEILSRFKAGGVGLKLLWYGFMLTAVLLAPLAVLLGQVIGRDLAIVPTATVVGVLAAVVQFLASGLGGRAAHRIARTCSKAWERPARWSGCLTARYHSSPPHSWPSGHHLASPAVPYASVRV